MEAVVEDEVKDCCQDERDQDRPNDRDQLDEDDIFMREGQDWEKRQNQRRQIFIPFDLFHQ
jgi:hypothetical protein